MSSIVRWNPIRELAAMQSAMDRLLNEGLRGWPSMFDEDSPVANTLQLDVHEDDHNYTVITELPGVTSENINVKLHDGTLLIEGEIPEQKVEKQGVRTLIQERRSGKFSRYVRLPQPVDADKVEASYENGVLTLTLPKSEAVQPRLIPIKTGK